MTCLVYCILLAAGKALPDISGVDGKPVRYVVEGELAAAFSGAEKRISPEMDTVVSFEEVIEAVNADFSVIPVRFGNYFDSPDALRLLLRDNSGRLSELLRGLAGAREMGIRVLQTVSESVKTRPAAEREPPATGRQYLLERKARFETAERLSERKEEVLRLLAERFSGLFTRMKTEEMRGLPDLSGPRLLLSAYFLVPEKNLDSFRREFSRLEGEGVKFLLSGPWPPYNFADFEPVQKKPHP